LLSLATHDPLAALESDNSSDSVEPSLDYLEAPRRRPRLKAEKLAGLTWPASSSIRLCFLCRKHPSVTFLSESLCELRKGHVRPGEATVSDYADFNRCLKCPGPYRLDTEEGLAVMKRLERLGRRTGKTLRWRKSHA
jgi:hypothetical protein